MAVFEQVVILFSFVTLGYIISKTGKVNAAHSKVLSSVLVNVLLPCSVLKSFSQSFTVEYLTKNYMLITVSLCVLLALGVAAVFGGKLFGKNHYVQKVYEYSLVVPNMGYMGYPLAEAMYGPGGLLNLMIFGLPISLYFYIYGYPILTKTKFKVKELLNPVMVTMALGIILGLSGIRLPD